MISASPSSGQVSKGTIVYLTAKADGSTISGADIYYTLDGTTPSKSSSKYYSSSGITINSNCTLKAIAYKSGYQTSDVMMVSYSIKADPKLVLSANPSGGSVSSGTRVYLAVSADGYTVSGADVYYTTDGTTPSKYSTKYYSSSGIAINYSCTLKAIAYKDGYETSNVLSVTYTIKSTSKLVLSASPSGGSVSSGTRVYLAVSADGYTVSGADVYYTTDGTLPSKYSTKYYPSSGITIYNSCTVQAIAYKDGYETSNVLSVSYTVKSTPKLLLSASPSGGSVSSGTKVYLTVKANGSTVSGADIYYTTDGTTPSRSKTKYTSSGITIVSACTLRAVAFKDGYENSDEFKTTYTVINSATEISLYKSTTVHLDDTKKLVPTIKPSGVTPTLTWTSSNAEIASVDQQGVVSGKKLGTARISVTTDNGKSAYCDIKVVKVFTDKTVEGITMTFQVLSEEDKTCQVGEDPTNTSNLSYTVTTRAIGYSTSGAVTIPSTSNGYKVKSIGGLAFLNLSLITSVFIPNTIESIGAYAFQGCSRIESLEIPNSVTLIGVYALSMCSRLTTVILPNTITYLNGGLFWKDSQLTSVSIPSSVNDIFVSAFEETGLTEIIVPNTVKSIGSSAFANCNNLEKVTSLIEDPFTIDENVFQNVMDSETTFTKATLYVPKGCKSKYQSKLGWKLFDNIVEFDSFTFKKDKDEPAVPSGWEKVITNGNFANNDVSCYFKTESGSDLMPASISEGIGKNNSRGIAIHSGDNPENVWDTMFYIRTNKKLGVGAKMHVEFDYKASQNAECQTIAYGEPQEYLDWKLFGSVNFTTNWQHFSEDIEIVDYLDGLQTIAFNLAVNKTATTYFFDNIAVWTQEQNDTTYIMMDFTQNPWNYHVTEVTKGWKPDTKDWDSPGAILQDNQDFSWPIGEGSTEKIKVTLYPVDIDESENVAVLGSIAVDSADAASLGVTTDKMIVLYTVPGTTMRFETPEGYKFGKMVFYTYRSSNFLVGDEYDEVHEYVYNNETFTQKLKFWTPDSPKENIYGYTIWEGNEKNVLFNYPYFNANFVKIDIRIVPDDATGVMELMHKVVEDNHVFTLDGRAVNKSNTLRKGIYITNGKKYIVK